MSMLHAVSPWIAASVFGFPPRSPPRSALHIDNPFDVRPYIQAARVQLALHRHTTAAALASKASLLAPNDAEVSITGTNRHGEVRLVGA